MLFLTALLFASALAAPSLLPQFSATVKLSAGPGQPTLTGALWFDYTNKGAFGTLPAVGNFTVFPSSGSSTLYGVASGLCDNVGSIQWSDLPPVLALPPGCTSLGSVNIDGVNTNGWGCDNVVPMAPALNIYLSAADNSFVRINGTVVSPGSPATNFQADFSQTQIGPFSPSIYAKPAGCN